MPAHTCCFEGYFWNWKLKAFERPLLLAGALLLIVPGLWTDVIGAAIIVLEFVSDKVFHRSAVPASATPPSDS